MLGNNDQIQFSQIGCVLRINVITTMTKLTTNKMIKICRGPESGFLKQKENEYKNNNIDGPWKTKTHQNENKLS